VIRRGAFFPFKWENKEILARLYQSWLSKVENPGVGVCMASLLPH